MKCIIIDDEPIARKGMARLIKSRPELTLEGEYGNADDALRWLADNEIDLVFLDIEMPKTNGIELARRISGDCMVVFTTAYSEYAVEGFDVDALDYLVKPIDPKRFNKAVDRAIAYRTLTADAEISVPQSDMEFIIVKADRRYMRVRLDDILFIEGLKDYVIIHTPGRKVITRMTIKAMEETLPASRFLRVNKSYIVNRDKIDSFDNNDIFIGDIEIAIGLSYKDNVIESLLRT